MCEKSGGLLFVPPSQAHGLTNGTPLPDHNHSTGPPIWVGWGQKKAMKRTALLLIVLAAAVAGCAVKVSNSYNRNADFSRYQTFCWLQGCEFTFTGPAYLDDSLIIGSLQQTIRAEMKKKGFVYNDEQPDLLLDFHVTVENRQTRVYRFEEDERLLIPDPMTDMDVYYYLEGTIIIDMVDRETGQMVWRSQASRYLELNPDLTEENLRKGIGIILKGFPPTKKGGQADEEH